MDRPDYVYVLREEDGDPSLIKIGHSVDPINRPDGYKAGNHRRLVVLFAILGGQELEAELHIRFNEYRIGTGGDEWFKLAPDIIDYLKEQMRKVLVDPDNVLVYHKRYFRGPSSIPPVELGEVEAAPVSSVASVDSIQPCSVIEATPPKDSRYKVAERKQG